MKSASVVLVVDDELTARSFVSRVLETLGYTVLQAISGDQALKIAQKQSIHLLLTDIQMPEMNGVELAERIRTILPKVKVLFMSGDIPRTSTEFIPKAFTIEGLRSRIGAILAEG